MRSEIKPRSKLIAVCHNILVRQHNPLGQPFRARSEQYYGMRIWGDLLLLYRVPAVIVAWHLGENEPRYFIIQADYLSEILKITHLDPFRLHGLNNILEVAFDDEFTRGIYLV